MAAVEAQERENVSVARKATRGGVAKLLADLELTKYWSAYLYL